MNRPLQTCRMHWTERMMAAADEQGIGKAELARRAGMSPGNVRQYVAARTNQPRGDAMVRIARALGVEYIWLRDGIGPRTPGDGAPDTLAAARAKLEAQQEFGHRVRQRRDALGLSLAKATAGLTVSQSRWAAIETGTNGPDLIELQVIAERLRESLDWLISGIVTPDPSTRASEPDRPARLHDRAGNFAHRDARPSKK